MGVYQVKQKLQNTSKLLQVSNKVSIKTKVVNGRLESGRDTLKAAIESHEGKRVEITVSRAKNTRTNAQNRWYWGVAVEMVRLRLLDLGSRYSSEQTHENLKHWICDFAPDIMLEETVIEETGVILSSVKSTTELTTTEFMAYKLAIQQWASENLGINIPDPDEQTELSLT